MTTIGALMSRLMAPAYFSNPRIFAWLTLTATALWAEHGPSPTLIAPASHLAFVTIARREDYRTGHGLVRRFLEVGRARRYGTELAESRFLYAVSAGHWFEPLEENVALVRAAKPV